MNKKEKPVTRYIVKANGRVVDWSFNKKTAHNIAWKFQYECEKQDEPFSPTMEIIEEVMNNGNQD